MAETPVQCRGFAAGGLNEHTLMAAQQVLAGLGQRAWQLSG